MRILHFSDTHLGAEIHGKRDPETGMHTQLKDFVRCLDFLVQTAVEESVDAVLFTGDAYHYSRPDPLPQREFLKRIVTLSERGVGVLLLAGNHDLPSGYGEASPLDIFPVVKIQGVVFARRPEVADLPTRRGALTIACLPYSSRRALLALDEERGLDEDKVQTLMTERTVQTIRRLMRSLDASDRPILLIGHLWVQDARLSGSERMLSPSSEPTIPPSALRQDVFAYVALGHIHRHQTIGTMSPPIVYAGSLARITFDEENETKGFVIMDLEQTTKGQWGVKDLRFVPTPTRPFITIIVDLHKETDPTKAALNTLTQDRRIDGAVVRMSLFVTEEQREQLNLAAIRENLEKRADHVASITVRTDDPKQAPTIAESRDWMELDSLLRQNPIGLLARWLDELSKREPDLAQRKERLMKLARQFIEHKAD